MKVVLRSEFCGKKKEVKRPYVKTGQVYSTGVGTSPYYYLVLAKKDSDSWFIYNINLAQSGATIWERARNLQEKYMLVEATLVIEEESK